MGPNGTGKSMSLQNIEYECNKENIICKRYSNKHNDVVQNWRDISDLFSAFRSEGERIIDSVEKWASRELVKDLLTNEDDMYILFDELDSGLSLDRMYYFFSQLTYILVSEKQNIQTVLLNLYLHAIVMKCTNILKRSIKYHLKLFGFQ